MCEGTQYYYAWMEVVSDEAKVSVLLQEAFGCEVVETQLSFYDELLITSYFLCN